MIVSVVSIGNSKGIRLPKALLNQLQISDKLDLEVDDQKIILKPVSNKPRLGWNIAFKEMHKNNEDQLLINESIESEDFKWEW
jgi:antitoxin MazE